MGNKTEPFFRCKFSISPSGSIAHSCAMVSEYYIGCEGLKDDRAKCPYWNNSKVA